MVKQWQREEDNVLIFVTEISNKTTNVKKHNGCKKAGKISFRRVQEFGSQKKKVRKCVYQNTCQVSSLSQILLSESIRVV